jgi:hypothetical protein
MTDYYDRDGNPLPDDWYDRKKHGDRAIKWATEHRVSRTVVGDITVSTVWLGLDHDYLTGGPIIFETMTFGDPWQNEMERYSSEEAAIRGHLAVLNRLRAGKPPFAYLDSEESR